MVCDVISLNPTLKGRQDNSGLHTHFHITYAQLHYIFQPFLFHSLPFPCASRNNSNPNQNQLLTAKYLPTYLYKGISSEVCKKYNDGGGGGR